MTSGGRRAKVLVVVGTRPEAIKMAPVLHALGRRAPGLDTRLVLTGQHSDLVDEALRVFELRADWDLGIMKEGQSLTDVARACLAGVDGVLGEWTPDLVVVQGDTGSAFFAGLSAYFHGVPVGHVEAGLRTGDLRHPFPEEAFRRLLAVVTELHFAPTADARENLLREGVPESRIHVTGNTVVDALLDVASRRGPVRDPALARLMADGAPPFALLTLHRRESFGEPVRRVLGAVARLVDEVPDLEVVYPVHPNPNVAEPARRILGGHPRVHLTEPLAYTDLVAALTGARLVLTDSGGIQEEAPTFGAPVIVLRDKSERPEGVAAGVARLVGTDPDRIVAEARIALSAPRRSIGGAAISSADGGSVPVASANPYGDGQAGRRIADIIVAFLAGDE